ncbi:MAG: GntR family transcriptional regulator [Dehalobacterium sp.]
MEKIPGERPLYAQIIEDMKVKITSQQWVSGQKIPSEKELEQYYGVSRICIRQAIAGLKNEGYLYSLQGKGTFACNTTPPQGWARLTTFYSHFRDRWANIGAKTISIKEVEVPTTAVQFFGIPQGELIPCIKRVRIVDGNVVILQKHYVSPNIPQRIFHTQPNFVSFSRLLADQGIIIKVAKDIIRAIGCPAEDGKILQVKPKTPILYIERFAHDQNHNPIEYVEIIVHTELWPYEVNVSL